MTNATHELMKSENARLYIAASGVGSSAILDAWKTPGASKYLVGGAFPYDRYEFQDFVGHDVDSYCSEKAALMLAMESFIRAQTSIVRAGQARTEEMGPAIGIGITGAVASEELRRGENRIHAAVISSKPGCSWVRTVTLKKGVGIEIRGSDEAVSLVLFDTLLLAGMGESQDDPTRIIEQHIHKEETREIQIQSKDISDQVMSRPYFDASGRRGVLDEARETHVFFPGTFNPLHQGHQGIATAMETCQLNEPTRYASKDVTYTICTTPVHKAPMDGIDMLKAIAMFRAQEDCLPYFPKRNRHLLFTAGDPLFVDKLKKRPGHDWIVGADTFDRMLDPKWGEPTFSVYREFHVDLRTHLYVFPCIWEGQRIDVRTVLRKYGIEHDSLHIHSMERFEPVDVRSSIIRGGR